MKHHTAIVATFVLSASFAQARVGETLKEIAARYGDGKKADTQRLAGAVTYAYKKEDFYVEVVILKGRSVLELYAHTKGMTDDIIKELLTINSTGLTPWHFARKTGRWERQGTPKLVAYRWPNHPDFFCIKDLDACEAAEKQNKPSAVGL